MADLEKQGVNAAVAASTPSDEHHEELADDVPAIQPKTKHSAQRSGSTTFAPLEKPSYNTTGDNKSRPRAVRSFSRQTNQSQDSDANYFGGTLSRTRTNMELERVQSRKQERSSTHESSQDEKDEDDNTVVVGWEGDNDPENPQNFSRWYKVYVTVLGAVLVLNSTFSSSAPNGVSQSQIAYFGFSREVDVLVISLWVAGYCLGPLVWGPLSERLGRRPVFLISIFAYTCWDVGCALSKNTASILVFRFLGGVFGAAPLTNSGGIIADVWDSKRRGIAMSLFAVAPFAGPALGPLVSGAIQVTGTSWRWVYWTITIFSGVCWVICLFTLRETFAPVILKKKAAKIRKETGDDFYKSPLDLTPLTPKTLLHDTVLFPFIMLVQEPILLAMGLYLSFVYGIIYLCFGAYPIIFEQVHGFNALIGGVMFLPIFLGGLVGVGFYIIFINPRYSRKVDIYARENKGRVPPEERLWVVCIAAPCLVVSFLWMGWTSYRSISFWSPMLAGGLLGFSVLNIFVGLFNYIVDAYLANAASALAGNTVMRSACGAGFPLFTAQMFDRLTIKWACTLLAGLALIMAPIPFALLKYGPTIRKLSKHTA